MSLKASRSLTEGLHAAPCRCLLIRCAVRHFPITMSRKLALLTESIQWAAALYYKDGTLTSVDDGKRPSGQHSDIRPSSHDAIDKKTCDCIKEVLRFISEYQVAAFFKDPKIGSFNQTVDFLRELGRADPIVTSSDN